MCKNLLILGAILMVGCERTSLSPVEIKIDDGLGGYLPVAEVNNTYTVKNNETLFDVANKFNIDPMNLAALNNIKAPYNVRNGQILKLPSEEDVKPSENTLYTPVQIDENKQKSSEKDNLDERFDKLMTNEHKERKKENKKESPAYYNASSSGKETSFNEQEKILSSPKVTKTATGADIVDKTEKQVSTAKKMVWPVKGDIVSKFGEMNDGLPNDGINIKAAPGTKVCAVSDGDVIYAGNNLDESFGNVVVVKHNDGLISSYANMGSITTKQGAKIKQGAVVGTVGNTGNVTSPQLHFEIMKDSTPLNPEKYLGK